MLLADRVGDELDELALNTIGVIAVLQRDARLSADFV